MINDWAQIIVNGLKESGISFLSGVPDSSLSKVINLLKEDDYFTVVPATREEEAIGIASGAYVSGVRAAVYMQSSGVGNSINALASLCLPARIPIPMLINLRGEVGEFNISQVFMGRSTPRIFDEFNIATYIIDSDYKLEEKIIGALKLCYASHQPLAMCLTPLLHGGKNA
ncbi:MAG: sulfopyruvate decarboxylase subunit alpha [SAR202 cluster bacterium]|nr:sulfopyruvate decarboxylase subunit alpha [SAR202 cluster bacterium]|tara:strand:- start:5287 stop:5799 length:513 start_codon:yes stop_codon:yes gene_type:complete